MQQKSGFLTILLSVIPGVGHLYLGLMTRGFTFLVGFFGWVVFVTFLAVASHEDGMFVLLLALPIIWFYGLFDALHQRRRLAVGEEVRDVSILTELSESMETGRKSRMWAMLFSFIPGVGHLYLGLKEQGLQLMGAFFLTLFLMDWMRMTFLIFLVPIIWFYGMFDALQKADDPLPRRPEEDLFIFKWFKNNHRFLAYVLIALGLFLLFDRLVVPYIGWEYTRQVQTLIISLLLIGAGIRLLGGSRVQPPSNQNIETVNLEEGCSDDRTEDQ